MRGWGGGSEPRPLPSWTVTSQSLPGLLAELASASVCASMSSLQALCSGLPLRPLPENRGRWAGVPHAPVRTPSLSPAEEQVSHQPMPAGPFALWVLSGCVQVGISCSWVSRELQLLSSASHPCRREPRGVSVGQRDPSIPHPFHPLPHCPPTAILGYKIRVPTHHWGPEAQGQRSKAWVNSPAQAQPRRAPFCRRRSAT